MDLYENQPIYDREPFESTSSPGPIVIRQSYIFPATVNTWAVTSTLQGITYKHIIGASMLTAGKMTCGESNALGATCTRIGP